MKFISTRNSELAVSFETALYQGLAPDQGLYVPERFTSLENVNYDTIHALGETIMNSFMPEIANQEMKALIDKTLNFPIPLKHLEDNTYLLEVFHGPTLAFKDVGARFMANVLSYYLAREQKNITIIVATSGDTGSAIAQAFYNVPNINVFILYPSKKITELQERQMTTLGGNIHALEIEGTFDDCQRLVKTALADREIISNKLVTTANSINIARLLPQIIYHAWGIAQLKQTGIEAAPMMVVPCGNLGNLTSAIYAKALGFSVEKFLAATNINAVFPMYLESGEFVPQASIQTFSNAMDVGNPSNFERLQNFYTNDHKEMQKHVRGIAISNAATILEIRKTYESTGYILDPHTAVGMAAARQYKGTHPVIVTATAHPAKFPEVIKRAIDVDMALPEQLQACLNKPTHSEKIDDNYLNFKSRLLR